MNMTLHLDVRPLPGPVRDQGERPTCLAHPSLRVVRRFDFTDPFERGSAASQFGIQPG